MALNLSLNQGDAKGLLAVADNILTEAISG